MQTNAGKAEILLDSIAKRGSGHTPDKQKPSYWHGGIQWVSLTDSSRLDQGLIGETTETISEAGLKNSSAVLHPAGTVILSRDAGVGKSAVLASPMAVSQHFIAWVCGPELNNWYLYYLFQLRKPEFERQAVGSTIKTIGLGYFRRLRILLPPLPDQHRIVEILDAADGAVRKTEALIAAKQQYKAAVAERLLTGKVRFPEFVGGAWREVRLDEMFRERSARSPEPEPLVLSCSKVYGIVPQSQIFSRQLASRDLSRYKFVEPGDLVFDPMLLWDASIAFTRYRGVVSPAYCTLQFSGAEKHDPRFIHHFFYSETMRHTYKLISQGTNVRRKKAPSSDFLRVNVRLPALAEQQRIAQCLGLLDREIALLRKQRDALREQKQGLMQRLLMGEVRVAKKEISA